MKTVRDILVLSVKEYHDTIFGRNSERHKNCTYLQRRGLFYNAMRRQFHYHLSNFRFTERLPVDRLGCLFREDGRISKIKVESRYSPWSCHTETGVMEEIIKNSDLEYLDTEARISFEGIKDFQFKF